MKEIEGLGFSSGMIPQPRPVPVTAQKASGMTLLKIIPVENPGICLIMPLHGASTRISSVNTAWRCITASRRIPAEKYALGFANDHGGFELRNSMSKGCAAAKDITGLAAGNRSCRF